jgi:hypothetical protein
MAGPKAKIVLTRTYGDLASETGSGLFLNSDGDTSPSPMATKLRDDGGYSGSGLFQRFGTLEAQTRLQRIHA